MDIVVVPYRPKQQDPMLDAQYASGKYLLDVGG